MPATPHSIIQFAIRLIQRPVGWALILVGVCFLILFGLQFPHSNKLDELSLIQQIHRWGDPVLAECASWIGKKWPPESLSFIPLVLGLVVWLIKLGVDGMFLGLGRLVGKLFPAPKTTDSGIYVPGSPFGDFANIPADSERGRDELLKRYRQIEDALKTARRKRCAFLSVDVVGSTAMKEGETETAISATFKAYEELLNDIFDRHAAWKSTWTPDGVMVCFLQLDLAVAAGQDVLRSLKEFNQRRNRLRTPFRVRAGLNEGEVAIFEDSRLEKVVDHVIDVAGHMQKEARPNTLWMGAPVHNALADKAGFRRLNQEVDGMIVFEWTPELVPTAGAVEETAAPVKGEAPPPPAVYAPSRPPGRLKRIGRYQIVSELGRGAMGAVYKARDPQIGRTVAIKIILATNQIPEQMEEYKQRFYREAQTAGQMSHPGIVTIYDVAEDEYGQPYLVMEFIEGKTLDKQLASAGGKGAKPFKLSRILDLGAQVADALDYAHRRNVIHRDIKPANILVTTEGKAKIADFGIAKLAGTQMTQTGLLVGTPAFMSPEQITGGKVDSRSDIFSYGIVLYWMCTGQQPFPGKVITEVAYKVVHGDPPPPRQLNAELPPGLEVILSRCLAKKREERYASAREIVVAFEALKAGQPVPVAPLPSNPRTTG